MMATIARNFSGLAAGLAAICILTMPSSAHAKPDKDTVARAVKVLERATRSGDFSVRADAVEGLGDVPKKLKGQALALVKDALEDPQWIVRRASIQALASLKNKGWEAALVSAMADQKVDAESGVMPLIRDLGPKKGIKLVIKAIKQAKFPRPERYVDALAKSESSWLIPAFDKGLKLKGPVGDLFRAALPNLPLDTAASLYQKRFKKFPPALQKTVLTRVIAAEAQPEHLRMSNLNFIKPLLKSKDASIAFDAAYILALRKDASGKAVLKAAAIQVADAPLRLRAFHALGYIPASDMLDACRPVIKDRTSPLELRLAAYKIFIAVGSDKLEKHLTKRLTSTDVNVRAAAVHYIGDVKGRRAFDDLVPLLNDGPRIIRITAARSLGRIGLGDAIQPLKLALRAAGTDVEHKIVVIESLAALGDAKIAPVVRYYIQDRKTEVRRAAVRALIEVMDDSVIPDLELALDDRDRQIQAMALQALIDHSPTKKFRKYKNALNWLSPDFVVRLVTTRKGKALKHLTAALQSKRDEMRAAAFGAIALLKTADRSELYGQLALTAKRQSLRLAALDALVELRGKKSVPLVTGLAKDTDIDVRVAAIAHLGQLGIKSSQAMLVVMMDDPNDKVAVAACAALLRL